MFRVLLALSCLVVSLQSSYHFLAQKLHFQLGEGVFSGRIALSASSLLICFSVSGFCSVLAQAHSYSCCLGQWWNLCSAPYSRMCRREQCSLYKFCGKIFSFEVFSKVSVIYAVGICWRCMFLRRGFSCIFCGAGEVRVFWFLREESCLVVFPCFVCRSLKNSFFIFHSSSVAGAVSRLLSLSMHTVVWWNW